MNEQTLPYLVPYLVSLAISGGVGLYAWRRRDVRGAAPFALYALAEASMTLGYLFELPSTGLEAKIFWDNTQFVGMLVAPLGMLAFAIQYTGRELAHPKRTWRLLTAVTIICLLLVFTDEVHGWVRPTAWLVPGEPFSALVYDFSLSFWVMTIFVYGVTLTGLFFLVGEFVRPQRLYRAQVGTVLIGVLTPLAGSLLTMMDITLTFQRDTTPLTFAIGNLILAWGLFRYRLFDIVPVARDTVIESMSDPVVVMDAQGRVVDLNPAAREVVGREGADVIGQPVAQMFSNWPDLVERYKSVEEVHTEITIGAGEDRRHFDLNISPLRDQRGNLAGRLLVVHDVTARVRAEEALQVAHDQLERRVQERTAEVLRLQHLLQNVTDSMPSALIVLDTEGRVLAWNPAAERLTGKTGAQVLEQPLWESCPELARYRELFEQALQEQQVAQRHREPVEEGAAALSYHDVDVFPLMADGVGGPVLSPVEGPAASQSSVEGVVLRIDDVTQRVQLEEMMVQSAKMASVGGLAAGVAHEISNPLGAILQSAQMLQMAFDTQRPRTRARMQALGTDPDGLGHYLQARGVSEYITGIRSAGERAAKIMSDLLSFSRRSSSKTAPRNLNELVEQTLDLAVADYDLTKKYDFRDVDVVRELASGLPQVVCDGQQIQQVVLNLLRNAAQAMGGKIERGDRDWQPRLTLRTSYQIENRESKIPNRVRLEVEDNGPGIPEKIQARLFEPFFTTKKAGEGTGLGLWLCWSIVVERHKGRIWAEPGQEDGTRFVVELPVGVDQGGLSAE